MSLAECVQIASAEHIECPECGKTFLGGAVVNYPPEFSVLYGQHTVARRVFCDHCDLIFGWEQVSSPDGSFLGSVLSQHPLICRNIVTIERFLKAHPQAAGVLQS